MKLFFLSAFTLIFLLSGCINTDAGFITLPAKAVNYHKNPVKFHVDRINFVNCENVLGKEYFINVNEEENIRQGLVDLFPELFTPNREKALLLDITIANGKSVPAEDTLGTAAYSLSGITMCLIPGQTHFESQVTITVETGKLSRSQQLRLRKSIRQGWFGMQKIFSAPQNTWFTHHKFSWTPHYVPLAISKDKLKDFLQIIVNQVCLLPQEEISRTFIEKNSNYTELLE